MLAALLCFRYVEAYVVNPYPRWQSSPYPPSLHALRQMSIQMRASDLEFETDLVPNSFDACKDGLLSSVEFLHSTTSECMRYSIDLLTPGLNPKLEQKAIMRMEYTFGLLIALMESLSSKHETTLFMFQSMGDAAGFQKYCSQVGVVIPDNVALTELDSRYMSCDVAISCALIIKARNHVGDPVLDRMREICDDISPSTLYLFFNCDWTDRVGKLLHSTI